MFPADRAIVSTEKRVSGNGFTNTSNSSGRTDTPASTTLVRTDIATRLKILIPLGWFSSGLGFGWLSRWATTGETTEAISVTAAVTIIVIIATMIATSASLVVMSIRMLRGH